MIRYRSFRRWITISLSPSQSRPNLALQLRPSGLSIQFIEMQRAELCTGPMILARRKFPCYTSGYSPYTQREKDCDRNKYLGWFPPVYFLNPGWFIRHANRIKMSFQTPVSTVSTHIGGLGTIDGFHYANGVEQYCGIPYASLSKRWTRSILSTTWENDYHNGTQLGNDMPRPQGPGYNTTNVFIPVPPNPNFPRHPEVDEKTALVLNIVVPQHPRLEEEKFPVLAWIHGGSLLFGSANYGIYDAVNLVSHSVDIGWPVVVVSFNYRLGLGGFLASAKIGEELKADGFEGNGNFGFTDQKVAMEWIQEYVGQFGGDRDNVTVFGQSAGGVSIGHQMTANNPMKFDRAICMSGLGSTLAPLDLYEHEALFDATCRYFSIDPKAADALIRLREVPEQDMANADHIIQGVPSGVGNPCNDGWFYASDPRRQSQAEAPAWLKSFMIGDVHDEGVIFTMNVMNDTYETVRQTLLESIQNELYVDRILLEYGITQNTSGLDLNQKICDMGGEAVFKIQNYLTANVNKRMRDEKAIFKYHFDQRSRLDNALNGMAYHGFDVAYLFGNLDNKLTAKESAMGCNMASAWIRFAWGQEPWWTEFWEVWGPDSLGQLETEEEDEHVRFYSRFKRLLSWGSGGLWERYLVALNHLLMKRGTSRTFEHGVDAGS
ncbi:hypothetical protein PMG11_07543 [Penicillium brasilianum]|uniref:Carboxylic ester hydrolase n=1 Tax=Penicillium brasilianum TaxID=104259 RepID=A0A0F7TU34_PENBI|nr:hypothetical protein PMG11_07543 [Penicillium brasilianum]